MVRADLVDFPTRNGRVPPWASATLPAVVAVWCLAPGAVAPEAAAVTVPVLVAMGERDVVADPRGEPRAYQLAPSVDLFVCRRMGHMHNFASTRELSGSVSRRGPSGCGPPREQPAHDGGHH